MKGATVIYNLQPLEARFPQIGAKVRPLPLVLGYTENMQERISEQVANVLITRRMSVDANLLRFTSLRRPEIACKQASVTTLLVSVV